ncbi:MAG: DUF2779 domain-containing protein [Balneolaceae bacterium]|nr:DUF2779 domain-containing protein [Balneolaceae bacterium]
MENRDDNRSYFNKFLFKTGLECPTRLFYHRRNYPEREEHLPFIEHYRFNKSQLIKLTSLEFDNLLNIDEDTVEQAAGKTKEYCQRDQVKLLNPVFIHNRLMANAAILSKNGSSITLYQVATKAYDPGRHSLTDVDGSIHPKWKGYILDLAYRVHVTGLCQPEWDIHPVLVLPNKKGTAQTDSLPRKLSQSAAKGNRYTEDRERLLVKLDVSKEVNRILSGSGFQEEHYYHGNFATSLEKLASIYFQDERFPVELGEKCRYCEFRIEPNRLAKGVQCGFNQCWAGKYGQDYSELKEPPVFNLIGPGTRDWLEKDIYLQSNVPQKDVYDMESILKSEGRITERHRQSLQVHQAKGKSVPTEIVKSGLYAELERWEYPLHFLDFEAGNYAVPVKSDKQPYHLVLFQFSCHTLLRDGTVRHHQWLDKGDPEDGYSSFRLVKKLMEVPNITDGTIVQYSNFERHALKIVMREMSQSTDKQDNDYDDNTLKMAMEWMQNIVRRHDSSHHSGPFLSDLSRLVKDFYYNRYMSDSLSVKDVLQTVMTVSPRLKEMYSKPYHSQNVGDIIWWQQERERDDGQAIGPYRLLANEYQSRSVRRGTEAMVVYGHMMLDELTGDEREECREALFSYCELDTLAMVMIYQHWQFLKEMRNSGT